jgi:hypothetical protein
MIVSPISGQPVDVNLPTDSQPGASGLFYMNFGPGSK